MLDDRLISASSESHIQSSVGVILGDIHGLAAYSDTNRKAGREVCSGVEFPHFVQDLKLPEPFFFKVSLREPHHVFVVLDAAHRGVQAVCPVSYDLLDGGSEIGASVFKLSFDQFVVVVDLDLGDTGLFVVISVLEFLESRDIQEHYRKHVLVVRLMVGHYFELLLISAEYWMFPVLSNVKEILCLEACQGEDVRPYDTLVEEHFSHVLVGAEDLSLSVYGYMRNRYIIIVLLNVFHL